LDFETLIDQDQGRGFVTGPPVKTIKTTLRVEYTNAA